MVDATIRPMIIALRTDLEFFTGLRSLYGILDRVTVSIAARRMIVMLLRSELLSARKSG